MIELFDVSFSYKNSVDTDAADQVNGIREVNLHIRPGEFVVLAGNSGCGKTTITRLINGLVPHYYEGELTGSMRVCGFDVATTKISALSAHVGSVFQNPRSQFFNVDTTSEMAFSFENRCVPPDQIRADIKRVAQSMNTEKLMDRSIFALSGGEKQKVACASIAVSEPEIMVLDESSSNLDAEGIDDLRQVLMLWKAEGKTIVVAEHRLYYLGDLADRLLIMRDGRIAEELDAAQIAHMTDKDAYARNLRAFTKVEVPRRLHAATRGEAEEADTKGRDVHQLECRNLAFTYKNSNNGISIPEAVFKSGEITAVMGRNGAGKSTFAHLLAGINRKGSGTVAFDGVEYPPKRRPQLCYMILQDVNHQLFTESVLDEVVLSAPKDLSDEEAQVRARKVLYELDLGDLADMHPMALSGGQKQRVAIASGVISASPVLLFDEPTSGLDLVHMRQVAALLRKLRDDGKVVIVITHDTELVCEVADALFELR